MANQSLTQNCPPRRKGGYRVLDAVDASCKAVDARAATKSLRLQIARWVNEGGAGDDDNVSSSLRKGNNSKQ